MATRAEQTGPLRGIWRIAALAAAVAIGVLLLAFLWFFTTRLYVGDTQGTVGIVENIEAPPESWRIVPAPDVEVLILWRAQEMSAGYPHSRCVRTTLMRTNPDGEYSAGSWWLAPSWPPKVDAYGDVYVFSPGRVPIVDRSRLAPHLPYTHILGPPAVNPWTGLPLPDETPLQATRDRNCPPIERL